MLTLEHVTKTYTGVPALRDVELSMGPGEIVGLFGENGAGKTTLMKCILGLLRHSGTVTLDGRPIGRENLERLSFATCEHSFFPNLSAQAHRDFYASQFPRFREKRFHALMDFFSLPLGKPIRGFSAGQKNQFEVILALSQGADYILMDEPFVGNDMFNREDFYKVLLGILEPQETILLSTHLLEEVSGFVSRAVLLQKGQIIGDVSTMDLDEQGRTVADFVKEKSGYRPDRVSKALSELTGEDAP